MARYIGIVVLGFRETRLAFSVMSFKCEYVGDLASELHEYVRKSERIVQCADAGARACDLRADLTPRIAALETITFVVGLMRLWLLDETGVGVRKEAQSLINALEHPHNLPRRYLRRRKSYRDRIA